MERVHTPFAAKADRLALCAGCDLGPHFTPEEKNRLGLDSEAGWCRRDCYACSQTAAPQALRDHLGRVAEAKRRIEMFGPRRAVHSDHCWGCFHLQQLEGEVMCPRAVCPEVIE
jgi:hypothetical protein